MNAAPQASRGISSSYVHTYKDEIHSFIRSSIRQRADRIEETSKLQLDLFFVRPPPRKDATNHASEFSMTRKRKRIEDQEGGEEDRVTTAGKTKGCQMANYKLASGNPDDDRIGGDGGTTQQRRMKPIQFMPRNNRQSLLMSLPLF